MRVATVEVYKFDELSDAAKDRAREWYREGMHYPWWDDAFASITAFCDHFGAKIKDYEIGAYSPSWINVEAENDVFRGMKLRGFNREFTPTGYCLDCTLWQTFYDCFKSTGSAKLAFEAAINDAVDDVVKDMEYQYSDDSVDEMLTINEYEFTENGKIY